MYSKEVQLWHPKFLQNQILGNLLYYLLQQLVMNRTMREFLSIENWFSQYLCERALM